MSASLKLVSLNVEYARHIDSSADFLSSLKPDIVCLQELYERDIPKVSTAIGGAAHIFAPMTRHTTETPPAAMGIAIFSRSGIARSGTEYYRGDPDSVPAMDPTNPTMFNNKNQMLAFCEVEKGGIVFKIYTTHFTWTPGGVPSDMQRDDMRAMLGILANAEEFVLTGDFNAPRGGEIFAMLAEKYKDNVPAKYTTSIDGTIHRAGQLPWMVDGVFSTPAYTVSDFEMISGVSDHCALVATISKAG